MESERLVCTEMSAICDDLQASGVIPEHVGKRLIDAARCIRAADSLGASLEAFMHLRDLVRQAETEAADTDMFKASGFKVGDKIRLQRTKDLIIGGVNYKGKGRKTNKLGPGKVIGFTDGSVSVKWTDIDQMLDFPVTALQADFEFISQAQLLRKAANHAQDVTMWICCHEVGIEDEDAWEKLYAAAAGSSWIGLRDDVLNSRAKGCEIKHIADSAFPTSRRRQKEDQRRSRCRGRRQPGQTANMAAAQQATQSDEGADELQMQPLTVPLPKASLTAAMDFDDGRAADSERSADTPWRVRNTFVEFGETQSQLARAPQSCPDNWHNQPLSNQHDDADKSTGKEDEVGSDHQLRDAHYCDYQATLYSINEEDSHHVKCAESGQWNGNQWSKGGLDKRSLELHSQRQQFQPVSDDPPQEEQRPESDEKWWDSVPERHKELQRYFCQNWYPLLELQQDRHDRTMCQEWARRVLRPHAEQQNLEGKWSMIQDWVWYYDGQEKQKYFAQIRRCILVGVMYGPQMLLEALQSEKDETLLTALNKALQHVHRMKPLEANARSKWGTILLELSKQYADSDSFVSAVIGSLGYAYNLRTNPACPKGREAITVISDYCWSYVSPFRKTCNISVLHEAVWTLNQMTDGSPDQQFAAQKLQNVLEDSDVGRTFREVQFLMQAQEQRKDDARINQLEAEVIELRAQLARKN